MVRRRTLDAEIEGSTPSSPAKSKEKYLKHISTMDAGDNQVKEVAKAAAEAAKFGTQAVKTTEKILTFTAKVLKEPAEQAAGIIGDRLRLFRWERQLTYLEKVNGILTERGIMITRAVPPKFALPVLENASLEEDDELQKLWAELLANAMDPKFHNVPRMAYIDIIKSLTPLDVKILEAIFEALKSDKDVNWDNVLDYSFKKEVVCKTLGITSDEYEVSIFNLFRTQCLTPAVISGGVKMGGEPLTVYKGSKAVSITPLGVDFVKSCIQTS